jgi:hypothetical protein
MDRERKKITKIQLLLQKNLPDNMDTAIIYFESFLKEPEFKNIQSIKAILKFIQEQTDGRISWELLTKERMWHAPTSAMITEYIKPHQLPPTEIGVSIHIFDPKMLPEYFNKTLKKQSNVHKLIEKDLRGNYFYDGTIVEINRDTIYFNIFDIIFLYHDQDGFISYEDIEKKLRERKFEFKYHPERNDRIQNAITNKNQGFFHSAKINGKSLKNKTLRGDKLVTIKRGEGIILNNPII